MSKISGVAPSVFIRSRNGQNIVENLRKQNGKERTWVVCSGDVKRMFARWSVTVWRISTSTIDEKLTFLSYTTFGSSPLDN